MSGIIVCLTLAAVLAGPPAQAAAPATQPAVQAEVRRLIEQLGSTEFKIRTAALARLKAIGVPAYEQIKAAAEDSPDAEVASNCEDLLEGIEPLVAAHRCIREHPHLAGALGALAKTHPQIVTRLGGTARQQVAALIEMRRVKGTAGVLDILYEWATKAKDASVRAQAGYTYVFQGIRVPGMTLVAKDARRRQRMTEFVFAGKGGWTEGTPPVQAEAMSRLANIKEAAPLFRAAAEKCIQAHPVVAKPLRIIAKTHPHIVAGLGGSADLQAATLTRLSRFDPAGEALDVLHHWATRAKDASVRSHAGYVYVLHARAHKTIALLEKDADRRRRFVEFALTSYQGWSDTRSVPLMHTVGRFMRFEELVPLFARHLLRLRKDPETDMAVLYRWLRVVGEQPESRHRQLVPAVMVFLDDTRTIERRGSSGGKRLSARVADHAIATLHRMTGKKWATGLPKISMYYGVLPFKSDAVRKQYVEAFRTWYRKHRAEFAPDPTIRPATQPAARK